MLYYKQKEKQYLHSLFECYSLHLFVRLFVVQCHCQHGVSRRAEGVAMLPHVEGSVRTIMLPNGKEQHLLRDKCNGAFFYGNQIELFRN